MNVHISALEAQIDLASTRKQLSEVTAERDRLRAALKGVFAYIDDQTKGYPWLCSKDLYMFTHSPAFKAAREALKGAT